MATTSTAPWLQRRLTSTAAFTRTELLAVIAMLAMLTILLFTSVVGAQSQNQAAVCLSNVRRLALAWQLYAEDNRGFLVGNLDGGDAQAGLANANRTWCVGWLDFQGRSDNTNVALLEQSLLWPYAGGVVDIYKCPSDSSRSMGTQGAPRVRSYSMNVYLGRIGWTAGYMSYFKLSDFVTPTPRNMFVFLDERSDSINDACFKLDMTGHDPRDPNGLTIVDFPGMYHDRSSTFSFADGHGEFRRWTDPRTTPPERAGVLLSLIQRSTNNLDMLWLQERASRRPSSK